MTERPQPQPFLGELPKSNEAERLDDQEADDHHPENDLLYRRDHGGVDRAAERRMEKDVQEYWRQQDEAGAEERSHDGADAADAHHEKDAERQVDVERRGLHRLQVEEREQRA